jgi:AraC-like DNA-binding protein
VIRLNYSQNPYENLLKLYARELGIKVKNNCLKLPDHIGEGVIRASRLGNGLQILLSDYQRREDLLFNSKKSDTAGYLLRFEEMIPSSAATPSKSAVFLTTTTRDQITLQTSGTQVKIVAVFFDDAWIRDFLSGETEGDLLLKFLTSNISSYVYEQMDNEYHRLMNEILGSDALADFEMMIVHNRIMLLIERFFIRMYLKMTDAHFTLKISGDDIARLKLVETELLKDFSLQPSLVKLSKLAAMSPSKLKISFKEMFGMPIYQYFQKQRMNKAKAMLLSKKYSIPQIGDELGFSSISSFTKAFKKSFDQVPADLIKDTM